MGMFDWFRKDKVESPKTESSAGNTDFVNVGKSILPLIKKNDDSILKIGQSDNQLITKPLCDDICVVYALDTGKQFEYISKKRLLEFGIPSEELHPMAMRNLKVLSEKKLQMGTLDFSDRNPQIKPFYALRLDGNIESSMMLVTEFWDHARSVCKDELIAVTIPGKNEIYFAPFKLMESFRTMKAFSKGQLGEAISEKRQLSESVYILKKEKWYLFQDEPEFFEKMYTE